jgi:hypothetical protein
VGFSLLLKTHTDTMFDFEKLEVYKKRSNLICNKSTSNLMDGCFFYTDLYTQNTTALSM